MYCYGGCCYCFYICICVIGINSFVFYYGYVVVFNDRFLENGDMVLFDMGVEYYFYGLDIICFFLVNGIFIDN